MALPAHRLEDARAPRGVAVPPAPPQPKNEPIQPTGGWIEWVIAGVIGMLIWMAWDRVQDWLEDWVTGRAGSLGGLFVSALMLGIVVLRLLRQHAESSSAVPAGQRPLEPS